jgi:hypothetical protein
VANLHDFGTVLSQGLSIVTAGNSNVSAYGPVVGRAVSVVALSVPSILDSTSVDTSFTVTGAAVGDGVLVGYPSAVSAGLGVFGFVSAANEVTLRLIASKGTTAQTAQTWDVSVLKRSFVSRLV